MTRTRVRRENEVAYAGEYRDGQWRIPHSIRHGAGWAQAKIKIERPGTRAATGDRNRGAEAPLLRCFRSVAEMPAQSLPQAAHVRRRCACVSETRARQCTSHTAIAGACGHPQGDAAQYRRPRARGAATPSARLL